MLQEGLMSKSDGFGRLRRFHGDLLAVELPCLLRVLAYV